jgi:thiamine-monophosphate kinase
MARALDITEVTRDVAAMARASEDDLIARFFAPLAGEGALALKDDAAVLAPTPGHELVVTTDAVVAGVHFLADDPASSIGRKALAVNLSDLAAKGADPRGFLLTLALPQDWTECWLADLARGLGDAARAFGCPLLGGDTVRSASGAWLSVAAFGEVPTGTTVRRTTARPGDRLCVTGTIGDAVLGLAILQGRSRSWQGAVACDARAELVDRYRHPRPRLAAAAAVRAHATAAMDVSDGLAGDLAKMMRASGATAEVDLHAVPLSPAARAAVAADPAILDGLVTGGDDYEILCAVPPARVDAFIERCAAAGVPAVAIGTVRAGEGLPVFQIDGSERRYARGSFSHF